MVTAHLIDENIDSGVILFKQKITVSDEDTIFDINEKLYQAQIFMILRAYEMTKRIRKENYSKNPILLQKPFQ